MQNLPLSQESRRTPIKDYQPGLLFICEKELTIPYLTYQSKDNQIYLTMQCNTLHPHVETISYEEYKKRNSKREINFQDYLKGGIHSAQGVAGYCQQHKPLLCVTCKHCHVDEYQGDLIKPQDNSLNLNLKYHCEEHLNTPLIMYCEQCNVSICAECANIKHGNHPTLNVKHELNNPKILKLKQDFQAFEEDYFNWIASAYTQTQRELKTDYENHKNVNKELFDIVRNILYTWDTLTESYDITLLRNVTNIADNLNTSNTFNYRAGNISQFQYYWKSNLVLNIHNIRDLYSFSVPSDSSLPTNNTSANHNTHITRNEGGNTPPPPMSTPGQQEMKSLGNEKEFEWITTIRYESWVYSLCKLNDNLYAAGVGEGRESKIHIVDYFNNKIIRSLTGHGSFWRWFWHKKSGHLLSWSNDSDIRIWNYSNGNWVAVLKAHDARVNDIVELKTGDIITVSIDKSIKYWNMNTLKCYKAIGDAHGDWITCAIVVKDRHWITGGSIGYEKYGKLIWMVKKIFVIASALALALALALRYGHDLKWTTIGD